MTDLPIYDRVMDDLTRLFTHHHYDATTTTPEAPVSLLDTIRQEISAAVTWGEDELRARLPTIARLADDAEHAAQSPLVQAALSAVLPPAVEQSLADAIARVDAELHAAEQRVQAAAPEPPAFADTEPPPAMAPAGPQVGGLA